MVFATFEKLPNIAKLLLCIGLLLLVMIVFKEAERKQWQMEGFTQTQNFIFKEGTDVYDSFYADIYDMLVYNEVKNDYEIGAIINDTKPNTRSVILDIGSGTGHHVNALASKDIDVIGIDTSEAMVAKAKSNYPNNKFKVADALDSSAFPASSFTHILCLYFTLYYMQDKQRFFYNAFDWLMPGGVLVVHLVDEHNFDPIIPTGNPLYIVSPQKYAKKRITNSTVHFNNFVYSAIFNLPPGKSKAVFEEKFKFKDGKTRKQEHILYMESIDDITNYAKSAGFIVQAQVDLLQCAYEHQYLFIFQKPASF
jgi:SAM-dependent methyltransferase